MDETSLAYYRLGLRLEQALLLCQHADGGMATDDVQAVRNGLGRLAVALERLFDVVSVGASKVPWENSIRIAVETWDRSSYPGQDACDCSQVESILRGLEQNVREFAGPGHRRWFDLGVTGLPLCRHSKVLFDQTAVRV